MSTSLSNWSPFSELSDLQKRLSSILSGSQGEADSAEGHTNLMKADWQPACDISEDDQEYLVTADLPEVKKDEVQIGVENGVLTTRLLLLLPYLFSLSSFPNIPIHHV